MDNNTQKHVSPQSQEYTQAPLSNPYSQQRHYHSGLNLVPSYDEAIHQYTHGGTPEAGSSFQSFHNQNITSAPLNVTSSNSPVLISSEQNSHNGLKRRSSDPDADIETSPDGQNKRKLSKSTRACDQCRRKKIRCDAKTVPETNELLPCSNCTKTNAQCDYSRVPQKRGPSKGYIRELSERVQQVEGQLAMQNAPGFRASMTSIDGNLTSPYPIDSPFSPPGNPSRRQSSIGGRNPFAGFDSRMGSGVNWESYGAASRTHRQSIAIPPDQVNSHDQVQTKPFWSEWTSGSRKQEKTTQTPQKVEEFLKTEQIEASYSRYGKCIHGDCPILPDYRDLVSICVKAGEDKVHNLVQVLVLASPEQRSSRRNKLSLLAMLEFLSVETSQRPGARNDGDSLILLWIVLLVTIALEHDLNQSHHILRILRIAVDLCAQHYSLPETAQTNQIHWLRCLHIVAAFSRLHAVSTGEITEPIPDSLCEKLWFSAHTSSVPRAVMFLSEASLQIQTALALLPQQPPREPPQHPRAQTIAQSRLQVQSIRALVSHSGIDREISFVRTILGFLDLVSLRQGSRYTDFQLFGPAINLVEVLVDKNKNDLGPEQTMTYNPLTFHATTLATFAILILRQADFSNDADASTALGQAFSALHDVLTNLSRVGAGTAVMTGDDEPQNEQADSSKEVFWADILLHMMNSYSPKPASESGKQETSVNEDALCDEMAALLRTGYGRILAGYAETLAPSNDAGEDDAQAMETDK